MSPYLADGFRLIPAGNIAYFSGGGASSVDAGGCCAVCVNLVVLRTDGGKGWNRYLGWIFREYWSRPDFAALEDKWNLC